MQIKVIKVFKTFRRFIWWKTKLKSRSLLYILINQIVKSLGLLDPSYQFIVEYRSF